MPGSHQTSLLNGSQWVSAVTEWVSEHSQWSDSGPIKMVTKKHKKIRTPEPLPPYSGLSPKFYKFCKSWNIMIMVNEQQKWKVVPVWSSNFFSFCRENGSRADEYYSTSQAGWWLSVLDLHHHGRQVQGKARGRAGCVPLPQLHLVCLHHCLRPPLLQEEVAAGADVIGDQQQCFLFIFITTPEGHVRVNIVAKINLISVRHRTYESIATVGEIRVWWRVDFQSGSRV